MQRKLEIIMKCCSSCLLVIAFSLLNYMEVCASFSSEINEEHIPVMLFGVVFVCITASFIMLLIGRDKSLK